MKWLEKTKRVSDLRIKKVCISEESGSVHCIPESHLDETIEIFEPEWSHMCVFCDPCSSALNFGLAGMSQWLSTNELGDRHMIIG